MIKIEVTGNSIPEVADKLLAIGASLQNTASYAADDAAREAAQAKRTPAKKTEVAEAAPVDPTPAPKSAPPAEVTESLPTTEEPSSTPADAGELEVVDLPIATIDFDTEIRAPALKVVEQCGKPVLEKILASFGVVKASHLAPERLPELLAELNKALGK